MPFVFGVGNESCPELPHGVTARKGDQVPASIPGVWLSGALPPKGSGYGDVVRCYFKKKKSQTSPSALKQYLLFYKFKPGALWEGMQADHYGIFFAYFPDVREGLKEVSHCFISPPHFMFF